MAKLDWRNWAVRAGALALAFLVWLHVVTERRYDKVVEARLVVEEPRTAGAAGRDMAVASALPSRVRVLVSGRGKDLLQLRTDDLLLRLKLEADVGRERTYRLSPSQVEVRPGGPDVQVEEVAGPKEVSIAVDYRTEREVPVRSAVEVHPAGAYVEVGPTQLVPDRVRISGPSGVVDRIEAVWTDSVVLADQREDVDLAVSVRAPGDAALDIRPLQVRARADIQILAEDEILQVPVTVRHAPGRTVELQPATVRVRIRGGVDVVAGLHAVPQLGLFVDYRQFSGQALPVQAEPDPRFQVVAIQPARVNVVVH